MKDYTEIIGILASKMIFAAQWSGIESDQYAALRDFANEILLEDEKEQFYAYIAERVKEGAWA